MGEALSIHRMPSRRASALRTPVVAVLLAALVTSCGSPAPTRPPSPIATAITSPTPSATQRPTPPPTVRPTPSPTATPTPTVTPIVGAKQTPCPGHASSGHRGKVSSGVSRNWAGYVVGATRGHVTCIEGAWRQPEVKCPATGHASVAVWVGIDGSTAVGSIPDSSATLAQVGTFADCTDGHVQYAAWYEFLPDLSRITTFALDVAAGDSIWAQVRWLGKGEFIATLINLTRHAGATQRWHLPQAPLLTAEWIVEDPAADCSGASCTFMDLARFTTASIEGAVTVSGSRYRLTSIPFPYLRTTMSRSGRTLATPSSLTSSGFMVAWKAS